MNFPESIFVIIEENDCPLYKTGDEFKLSGRSLSAPKDKPACLTLASDITRALETWENLKKYKMDGAGGHLFNCSGNKTGCGITRIGHQSETKFDDGQIQKLDHEVSAIAGLLARFSMFKTLSEFELKEIVSYFRIREYPSGETIIKIGEPGVKLYIVVSGEVEVIGDHGIHIASLGKGEVFGEMSLLSGDPVVTTIKTVVPSKLLYLYGPYFRRVLNRFPSIQIYFARLLARRPAQPNTQLSRECASGIIGVLTEISPSELLQTLNMNRKTGVVTFSLSRGPAEISLLDGNLVRIEYDGLMNEEAFFEILKEREGRFKFNPGLPGKDIGARSVGDFMWLLMEGLNRIDEQAG